MLDLDPLLVYMHAPKYPPTRPSSSLSLFVIASYRIAGMGVSGTPGEEVGMEIGWGLGVIIGIL